MKTVTALELRKKLGGFLNDVSKKKERILISRTNRPLAVLIPVEEYREKVLRKDRTAKLKDLSVRMEDWRRKHLRDISRVDVVKAVRETRERR